MKKFYYIPPLILQTFIWIPTRIILNVIYCYSVDGLENLKELKCKKLKMNEQKFDSLKTNRQGGIIFAVNHSSELDPVMIPASLPFLSHLMPMFYVSREQKFYENSGWRQRIYGGRFFNSWGAYNAYTGLKNYDLALKHHINILNNGRSVCIFPEGHKTKDGSIGEGKSGVCFLSQKTDSPIVPVKIEGLYKPLAKKDKLGRTKLKVVFGKPIYPKEVSIEDFKKNTEEVMNKIRELN
ncbi:1-acyl-sn-glycerol-3-phosphate acyltransferase [Patescibacteria group bacterium]|nr:1-acyl-sn-glycerol-3-phosphate acyltransferase [Patescibacteria group bacterium]MCG2694577.1 1-acyl-sn-glycerol-3-phosphate acyltransferase [Candidatus Parcubacteria bacterium]